MSRNAVETVMGAVVLVVAAVFLFFAYTTTKVTASTGNTYTAQFDRIDGIRDGSDVRINGIKVGQVLSQSLDTKTFYADMTVSVDSSIKLSKDTAIHIKMNGLLGDKYVEIDPGNEDEIIPPGGRIASTYPAIDLEAILGSIIHSPSASTKDSGGSKDTSGGAPAPAPAAQGGNAPAPQ